MLICKLLLTDCKKNFNNPTHGSNKYIQQAKYWKMQQKWLAFSLVYSEWIYTIAEAFSGMNSKILGEFWPEKIVNKNIIHCHLFQRI